MDMNDSTVNHNITEEFTNSIKLTSVLGLCFLSLSAGISFPLHSYVIWLILRGSENRIASEFLNLNLSVCEISFCLYCVTEMLAIWFSSLKGPACFFKGLPITGRPLFQCLICVERYLAVVHPLMFLKYKPLRYRMICSVAAWIISLISCVCSMYIFLFSTFVVFTCYISMQFLIFLSIQMFFCLAVLRVLRQSGPGERGREREEENHMKRRAFYLILITTLGMLVTYCPAIYLALNILMGTYVPSPLLIGFVCFAVAGFVHPILYLHRAGKIRCISSF